MDLFDKIMKGASEIGKQAQAVVEYNRLKLQIMGLKSDISKINEQIGKKVYEEYKNKTENQTDLRDFFTRIQQLEEEISLLEKKLQDCRGIKICGQCGGAVEYEAKFCPQCGAKAL